MLIVSECASFAEFEVLRSDWHELLNRANNVSVFATWEWVEAFWKHGAPDKQLLLLVARNGQGELMGLLPLARAARLGLLQILEVAGCSTSGYPIGDYGGPIVARGMERGVWQAMLAHLKKSRWAAIDLRNCQSGDPARANWLTQTYQGGVADFGWTVKVQTSDACRLIPLPATFDDYLDSLSSNSRQNLRRKLRKFQGAGHTLVQVASDDAAARNEAMEALFALHQERWAGDASGGIFATEQARTLHKHLADNLAAGGMVGLRLARSAEGQIIGVIYNYRHNGVGYFYALGTSQDPKWSSLSLGVCLLADSIRDAIEAGCHTFDLLRGNHGYKSHFGGYPVSNLRVTVYRYGWLPQALAVAASLRSRVRKRLPVRLESSSSLD
ncbi:MAG: GNAT family N-acetyltransferase [Chloroflexi bacterium]|nr:GNAT family N-acetyltransferase [Chloroflexota bacterium]